MVEYLIDKMGANIEVGDKDGKTPVHYASWNGSQTVANFLIRSKANLNAKDKIGRTPLRLAASFKHQAVVDILMKAGAKS